jgi:hypothetical protein
MSRLVAARTVSQHRSVLRRGRPATAAAAILLGLAAALLSAAPPLRAADESAPPAIGEQDLSS